MYSPLPPDEIERHLRAWGSAYSLVQPLSGGVINAVWEVRRGGERFALRLSKRPPPSLAWELDLTEHLRAHGLRVPATIPALDGQKHVGAALMPLLDGDPPASEAEWRAVVETLARIHAITTTWPQRPGASSSRDLLTSDGGSDIRLDSMPPDVARDLRAAWQAVAHEPTSVVHGDPNPSNIRISSAGVGLLDWDEARVDASVFDVAGVAQAGVGAAPSDAIAAADAWEVAIGWVREPEYARRRLARLRERVRPPPLPRPLPASAGAGCLTDGGRGLIGRRLRRGRLAEAPLARCGGRGAGGER